MYGTNPNDVDTDDDGVKDKQEVEAGRDPLTPDAISDYYVAIPAKGALQYPAEELVLSGNVVLSAWIRMSKADVAKSFVIASRKADVSGYQFKLEIMAGVPVFTVGSSSVTAAKAVTFGKGEFVWFKLEARRTADKLTLTVTEDADGDYSYSSVQSYEADNYAVDLFASTNDILVGDAANEVAFGIDEFQLYGTTSRNVTTTTTVNNQTTTTTTTVTENNYLVSSSYNDLGKSFENSATAYRLELAKGKSFILHEKSAAKAFVEGAEYTTCVNDFENGDADGGTVEKPRMHEWFTLSDRSGSTDADSDGDGMPDW